MISGVIDKLKTKLVAVRREAQKKRKEAQERGEKKG
jgi:hypothetical protein